MFKSHSNFFLNELSLPFVCISNQTDVLIDFLKEYFYCLDVVFLQL